MPREPRNLFYDLLIFVCVAFVVTGLAYALVPFVQQPPWLQAHGWKLLLVEVGLIIVLGLLSMGLDRIRSLRKPARPGTMASQESKPSHAQGPTD